MDHKLSKPDTDSWVDDRMAKLEPAAEWTPDASRALHRLTQRKPSSNLHWTRVAMTTTILAGTALVLVMLPWQRLWTPKPAAVVTAQAQTGPTEKPAKKAQETLAKETSAPKQASEAAKEEPGPQASATSAPEKYGWDYAIRLNFAQDAPLPNNLPNNEKDVALYPEQMAQQRGAPAAQASPTADSDPVIVRNVIPEYSDEARKEKILGTIIVRITVKVDGTVQFENFQKTLGYGLDEKAREAVEQWLFTPAKKDGVAVAKIVDVSLNFSLR